MIRSVVVALAVLVSLLTPSSSVAVDPAPAAAAAPEAGAKGLRERLEAIPGMRVERRSSSGELVVFELSYRQPVNHRDPAQGTFRQRLRLYHVGTGRPMVLHTTGYALPSPFLSEPAELLDANQIDVEQRYFRPSRPQPARWRFMTIRQAAADHHRIVAALRPIYGAAWISTGASKGGMTSVYHRRFYPRDVAGTVAYVAPNDVNNRRDSYVEFIQRAGDRPACNRALRVVQRQLLLRRDRMLPLLRRLHERRGLSVDDTFGSVNRAFEAAVLDTPFVFWQYFGEQACGDVPGREASGRRLFRFVDQVAQWGFYSDNGIRPYETYFYQAAKQLGWPNVAEAQHLDGLLDYRQAGSAPASTPLSIRPEQFDADAMDDIDAWVRGQGRRLLFVYGENDPWSAEPFRLGRGSVDSAVLVEPDGNHGASIRGLAAADKERATEMLIRWSGQQPGSVQADTHGLRREVELRTQRQ